MTGVRQHQSRCVATGGHGQDGVAHAKFIGTIIGALVIIATIVFAVNGLWHRSDSNKRAVNDAVASLEKIHAAVQIGVSYTDYRPLIVNAKYSLNRVDELGISGERVTQIHKVFQNYLDAYTLWEHEIHSSTSGGCFLVSYPELYDRYKGVYKPFSSCKDGMQLAWATAGQNLEETK